MAIKFISDLSHVALYFPSRNFLIVFFSSFFGILVTFYLAKRSKLLLEVSYLYNNPGKILSSFFCFLGFKRCHGACKLVQVSRTSRNKAKLEVKFII